MGISTRLGKKKLRARLAAAGRRNFDPGAPLVVTAAFVFLKFAPGWAVCRLFTLLDGSWVWFSTYAVSATCFLVWSAGFLCKGRAFIHFLTIMAPLDCALTQPKFAFRDRQTVHFSFCILNSKTFLQCIPTCIWTLDCMYPYMWWRKLALMNSLDSVSMISVNLQSCFHHF